MLQIGGDGFPVSRIFGNPFNADRHYPLVINDEMPDLDRVLDRLRPQAMNDEPFSGRAAHFHGARNLATARESRQP